MAPQEIQTALRKSPFEPFRLVQTDGTAYDVRHPEMLLLGLRFAVVGMNDDPAQTLVDRTVTLDLLHVVRMEPLSKSFKAGNGQGN